MITEFKPNYATPPGETLAETLAELGMTQTELARRMGRPVKTINEIIQAKAAVTADTALELERVLGVRASVWCGLESNYRENLARQRAAANLTVDESWLKEVPLKEMHERGWLPKCDDRVGLMESVLRFFGVAGHNEWKAVWEEPLVAYRKSPTFAAKNVAIAAWIRKAEIEGRTQTCMQFDASRFRQALEGLRSVTLKEPEEWVPLIQRACNACGVAYVFVPELPGCRVSGATRWLRDDCALIVQSGRHKDDGHFWFTFFHEAKHVLQGKQKKVWTIEVDGPSSDPLERDADAFAADLLVPSRLLLQTRRENGNKMPLAAAQKLADQLGVAPGIVAGHLQHEGYWKPMVGNELKKRFCIQPDGTLSGLKKE